MEGFISGYVCPKCWSTAGGCPCSFDLRRSVVSTAFQIGGGEVKNMPSTVRTYLGKEFKNEQIFHFRHFLWRKEDPVWQVG